VPARRRLIQIWSDRVALEPFVEFNCHRREKMPPIDSIEYMVAERTAAGIAGRPDPYSRHGSADSVDNLRRDALRFFGARFGLF
jgi:hypothetical protein